MEATTQLSSYILHCFILKIKILGKGNKLFLMRSIIKCGLGSGCLPFPS